MSSDSSSPPLEKIFFIGIDKPPSITSHDVVATLRAVTGIRKVGHTGTLDPFATGVLVLAFHRGTRLIQFLPSLLKVYQTRLQLGIRTQTGDPEGEIISTSSVPNLSTFEIENVLQQFVGRIIQKPPIYSAIKVNGKRLYEYAREGLTVEIPEREVVIHSIALLKHSAEYLDLEIVCEKGTYIRALGCDIAERIGTVGHLSSLRRIQSDGVDINQTISFGALSKIVANTTCWQEALVPKGGLLHPRNSRTEVLKDLEEYQITAEEIFTGYPQMILDEYAAKRVGHGESPRCSLAVEDGTKIVLIHRNKIQAIAKKEGEKAKILRVIAVSS